MDLGRACRGPTRLLLLGGHFPFFEEALSYSPRVSCSRRALLPHTRPSPGFNRTPPNRFDKKAGIVPERGKGRNHRL